MQKSVAMKRREFLIAGPAALLATQLGSAAPAHGRKKGVMLMNRIGPSASELYIANADGTQERPLLRDAVFDYHASFSVDGK